ncbi:hypothetical protein AAE478_002512 [Parahypoxylon ruwenzoriense]
MADRSPDIQSKGDDNGLDAEPTQNTTSSDGQIAIDRKKREEEERDRSFSELYDRIFAEVMKMSREELMARTPLLRCEPEPTPPDVAMRVLEEMEEEWAREEEEEEEKRRANTEKASEPTEPTEPAEPAEPADSKALGETQNGKEETPEEQKSQEGMVPPTRSDETPEEERDHKEAEAPETHVKTYCSERKNGLDAVTENSSC